MTTTRALIERAYRKIGVVAVDEPMTADQGQTGLVAINSMMHGWELQGITIGHSDLLLAGEFSMADRFQEAVVYCLAAKLAPDNGVAPPMEADMMFRQVQTHYIGIPELTLPLSLTRPPSRGYRGRW